MEQNADPTVKDSDNYTPVTYAGVRNEKEMVRYLLANGSKEPYEDCLELPFLIQRMTSAWEKTQLVLQRAKEIEYIVVSHIQTAKQDMNVNDYVLKKAAKKTNDFYKRLEIKDNIKYKGKNQYEYLGKKVKGIDGFCSDLHNLRVTDADLENLAKTIPNVTSLDLQSCENFTDVGIKHIKDLKQLRSLWIWNDKITDAGLTCLENLTNLQSLRVVFCKNISDEGLLYVKNLTNLQTLDFASCKKLTGSGLQYLSGLTQLEKLDLSSCEKITDSNLKYIQNLKQLKNLELDGCSLLTDAGLEHLKGLTELKYLDLKGCPKLTGSGLQYLSGLTQLKNLNLDGCSLLTDAGLEHLKGLTELKYLELKKCPNITGAGIDLLQKSLPDCKISAEPKNTSSMNNSNSSNGKTSTTETNSQSDSKKSSLNQSKELKAPKPTTSVEDAIGQKDYVTLSKLIALKPSIVTEKDVYKGNTLLHRSAYNVDLVKCLVENGADVHAKDRSGRTPIFYAVINEEQDVVEYLLQHGEQINVKDKENRTPLFCAAELEKKTLAEFLINKGADINAKDIYENNLLHHVVLKRVVKYNTRNRSQLEMLEFLKEKGTDINAKNKYGQLPFDMIEIKVEPDLVGSFFDHSPQNKTTADPRMKKVVDEIKSLLRPTGTTKGQL